MSRWSKSNHIEMIWRFVEDQVMRVTLKLHYHFKPKNIEVDLINPTDNKPWILFNWRD